VASSWLCSSRRSAANYHYIPLVRWNSPDVPEPRHEFLLFSRSTPASATKRLLTVTVSLSIPPVLLPAYDYFRSAGISGQTKSHSDEGPFQLPRLLCPATLGGGPARPTNTMSRPTPTLALSDLVRHFKIETVVSNDCTQHVLYISGTSAHERRVRREETWVREDILGQGAYGTVHLERCDQEERKLRAVKVVKKCLISGDELDYGRELEAVTKFSHPKVGAYLSAPERRRC